jgi:hypothetical protein
VFSKREKEALELWVGILRDGGANVKVTDHVDATRFSKVSETTGEYFAPSHLRTISSRHCPDPCQSCTWPSIYKPVYWLTNTPRTSGTAPGPPSRAWSAPAPHRGTTSTRRLPSRCAISCARSSTWASRRVCSGRE